MAGDVPIRMFSTSCSHADALLLSVLRYEVARQVPYAGDMMARITADQLTQHLTASGFVVMKGGAQRDKRSLFVPGSVRLWAFGLCGGTESGRAVWTLWGNLRGIIRRNLWTVWGIVVGLFRCASNERS